MVIFSSYFDITRGYVLGTIHELGISMSMFTYPLVIEFLLV